MILERLLADRADYEQLAAASREAALAYMRGLTCQPFEAYLEKIVQSPKRREMPATEFGAPPADAGVKPPLSPEKQRLMILRLRRKKDATDVAG